MADVEKIERNTHLLDWLNDGWTHCQHGTRGWCESYLHNARDVIKAQDDELSRLREALEPFARADRAIGDEPGPFRFETERGYRLVDREHFRVAARALSTQVEERE